MGTVRHDGKCTAIIITTSRRSSRKNRRRRRTIVAVDTGAAFDADRAWRGEWIVVPRHSSRDMKVALVFAPVRLVCNALHHQHAVRIGLKHGQATGDGPRPALWPVALLDSVIQIGYVAGDQLTIHCAHRKFAFRLHTRSASVHRHALSVQDSAGWEAVAVWIRIAGAVMQARVAAASVNP